ncbi:hypothetical protein [Escherichia sp. E2586]|nr:hypothetical protein [Escherichia sp. E2586]
MDETQLQALANELTKNLKTTEDLSQFCQRRMKSGSSATWVEENG